MFTSDVAEVVLTFLQAPDYAHMMRACRSWKACLLQAKADLTLTLDGRHNPWFDLSAHTPQPPVGTIRFANCVLATAPQLSRPLHTLEIVDCTVFMFFESVEFPASLRKLVLSGVQWSTPTSQYTCSLEFQKCFAESLSGAPELTHLRIHNCGDIDKEVLVSALTKLPCLQTLQVEELIEEGNEWLQLNPFHHLPHLRHLKLDGYPIPSVDVLQKILRSCAALQSLFLDLTELDLTAGSHSNRIDLGAMADLRELVLEGCYQTEIIIPTDTTSIRIGGSCWSDQGALRVVAAVPGSPCKLKEMFCDAVDDVAALLAKLNTPFLTHLRLNLCSAVNGFVADKLPSLVRVRHLELVHCEDVTPDSLLPTVCRLVALQTFTFQPKNASSYRSFEEQTSLVLADGTVLARGHADKNRTFVRDRSPLGGVN